MHDRDLAAGEEPVKDGSLEDSATDKSNRFRSALSQILAATAKNVLLFGYGLTLGFPTLVIPALQDLPEGETLHLTEEQVSWIGSINLMTVPLGSVISGIVSQKFGRKRTMQVMNIPFLASWLIFYYAQSVEMLYLSLALTGFAGGILEAPVLTYIAEISEPYLRGILSVSSSLTVLFAICVQFLIGSFLEWRTISAISAAAPILGFIVLFFIPESPHWLMSKNRFEDTRKALCWLRGWTTTENIQDEYDELFRDVHSKLKSEQNEAENKSRFFKLRIENYRKRTFIRPFLLITFTFVAGHFVGTTTLSTYSVNIFNSFGAPINAYYANLLLGLSQFAGILICMVLIHSAGKRRLTFASAFGSSLLFIGVGLYGYFYLGISKLDNGAYIKDHFQDGPSYSWFPMVCFIGGSLFSYLALRILPWVLVGEVYPTEIRGLASGISTSLGYLLGFLANKTFFDLIAVFTLPGLFILYGAIGIVSIAVFYFCLPETEGWTLMEIEEHFNGLRKLTKIGRKKVLNLSDVQQLDNPEFVHDETTKF